MRSRLPIVAGLLSGVLVALLIVAAIVALAPDPAPSASPPGTPGPSLATPTASASSVPQASGLSPGPTAASANFHVGQTAPPLQLPLVGGGTIDLATLRGRPVWVNFMRTDCPPCRDEFPQMSSFAARYASTNLAVLAVDIRESEGAADAFARSLGTIFPVALDSDGAAQAAWGAVVLPVHFWIDKDGTVREGALGGIGPDLMAHGLSTILPGVTVTP